MGMGIGKQVWVQVLKHHYGPLEECIEWMKNNPPKNNQQFFDIHPQLDSKKMIVKEYQVNLVKFDKPFKTTKKDLN